MKNSKLVIMVTTTLRKNKKMSNYLTHLMFHQVLIGSPLEPSMLSKIKDNVDHVGLSQLSLLWKVPISLKMENFYPFPNNNLLIVTQLIKDVMVD